MLPILRRRASNWNLPKHESESNQPLALARFFAPDQWLLFRTHPGSPPLGRVAVTSFHQGISSPSRIWRNLYAPARAHTHTRTYAHLPACTWILSAGRMRKFRSFIRQSEVRNIDEERGRDKCEQPLPEYLPVRAERICVQICIGCPVFSLPEFASS